MHAVSYWSLFLDYVFIVCAKQTVLVSDFIFMVVAELPERSYGADCRIYVPENPTNRFKNVYVWFLLSQSFFIIVFLVAQFLIFCVVHCKLDCQKSSDLACCFIGYLIWWICAGSYLWMVGQGYNDSKSAFIMGSVYWIWANGS